MRLGLTISVLSLTLISFIDCTPSALEKLHRSLMQKAVERLEGCWEGFVGLRTKDPAKIDSSELTHAFSVEFLQTETEYRLISRLVSGDTMWHHGTVELINPDSAHITWTVKGGPGSSSSIAVQFALEDTLSGIARIIQYPVYNEAFLQIRLVRCQSGHGLTGR